MKSKKKVTVISKKKVSFEDKLINVLRDMEENQEDLIKAINDLTDVIKTKVSNLNLKIGENKMANLQLGINQRVPYVVNHQDGTPLKQGNTVRVLSSDVNGASIEPDATPLAGIGTGFVVAGPNVQVGLNITAQELDANGVVIDSAFVTIDIVAASTSNLSLTLGTPVAKSPLGTSKFASPFGR